MANDMVGRANPYTPRELSRKEVRDEDIYTFRSPKQSPHRIRVIGIPALMLALKFEFEPDVESFVERPRLLRSGDDIYEFSFWYRTRSGREYLPLIVPIGESLPAENGRRSHRKAPQLLAAAQDAHLPLSFVFEADLLEQASEFSTWLRLLPGVQLAQRLGNRLALRERIIDIVGRFERCRISQVVDALEGYVAADVRCVVCDLIHAGCLIIDPKAKLNLHSLCMVRRQ